MKLFKGLRGRVILIVIVLAIVVAVPVIALSYAYTATPLAKVTITGGNATFEQGTIGGRGTIGDIGPSPQEFGGVAQGYPLTLSAGGHFVIGIQLANSDNVSHTLNAIHVAAPFAFYNASVPLPATLPAGSDATLYVGLTAPTTAGTYNFDVTIVSFS